MNDKFMSAFTFRIIRTLGPILFLWAAAAGAVEPVFGDGLTAPRFWEGERVTRCHGMTTEEVARCVGDLMISYDHHAHSYRTAVILYGLIILSDVTGDPKYYDWVKDFWDYYLDHVDQLAGEDYLDIPTMDEFADLKMCPWCLLSEPNITDNPEVRPPMPMMKRFPDGSLAARPWWEGRRAGGPSLWELALRTKEKKYIDALGLDRPRRSRRAGRDSDALANYPKRIVDGAPGSANMAREAVLTGDDSHFDRALDNVLYFEKRHWNAELGLFHQGFGYGVHRTNVSPSIWCRGTGWWLYGAIEALEMVPKDRPGYDDLLDLFRRNIEGIKRAQDSSGMLHQCVDRWDSYPETSGTPLMIFAVAKAVRLGLLSKDYVHMARKGFEGLKGYIDTTGIIRNCCIGCGA
ncbi:glycoside hydrolase family 88 protein, partial [candidate division KSB1 bacterium]